MSYTVTVPIKSVRVNGMFRYATLFDIHRKDGTHLRFTDHNASITYGGQTFSPLNGVSASARQKREGNHPSNFEVIGVIGDTSITDEDLQLGKYRGAKITETVVDWKYPDNGYFRQDVMWIGDYNFTDEVWQAQVTGLVDRLRRQFGGVLTRTCRWKKFGDEDCGVDLTELTDTGEVTTIVNDRVQFATDLTQEDAWYNLGLLVWTSGANVGISSEVRDYLVQDGMVHLQLETPFSIEVGDEFEITPGCDGTIDRCGEFKNEINFGGFEDMEGTDKMLETPDAVT